MKETRTNLPSLNLLHFKSNPVFPRWSIFNICIWKYPIIAVTVIHGDSLTGLVPLSKRPNSDRRRISCRQGSMKILKRHFSEVENSILCGIPTFRLEVEIQKADLDRLIYYIKAIHNYWKYFILFCQLVSFVWIMF